MIFPLLGEFSIKSWKTSSCFNRKNVIKLRICKCDLFKQLLKYLGLMVSIEIYEIDPSDDAALKTLGKNPEDVRKSIAFCIF